MTVRAVIFDWGGTLTPWHSIDPSELWQAVCARHYPAAEVAAMAAAAWAAEVEFWRLAESSQRSSTLAGVFARAGITASAALLASYFDAWDPHTITDPDAAPLMRELRRRGIKVGVLSNTMWPRAWHEEVFRRDGVLHLIDGSVYSSEIAWTKPHREAFGAAMAAIGVTDPGRCVFVGDRPYDDIHGAQAAGMRAVLIPNSDVPPFADAVPDAIVSSLAIHNIPTHDGRRQALDEAIRVLRPGARLAIADLWETNRHAAHLRDLGWHDVRRRNLGWRMWYGGPWFATRLVTATKPG